MSGDWGVARESVPEPHVFPATHAASVNTARLAASQGKWKKFTETHTHTQTDTRAHARTHTLPITHRNRQHIQWGSLNLNLPRWAVRPGGRMRYVSCSNGSSRPSNSPRLWALCCVWNLPNPSITLSPLPSLLLSSIALYFSLYLSPALTFSPDIRLPISKVWMSFWLSEN